MNKLVENVEIHDELNQKIWDGDVLRPEVKTKIYEIVECFEQQLDIDLNILDIFLLGSNASYNYNDKSDLDVHIVVNFETIDANKELVQAYLNSEKTRFNGKYDISLHEVPIEVYVEDVKAMTLSNGIYSMYQDKWVKYPQPLSKDIPNVNLEPELTTLKNEIDTTLQTGSLQDIVDIINKLYLIRHEGLSVDGEYSKGNLVFKELRNDDYLEKLKDKMNELQGRELSLESYSGFNVIKEQDPEILKFVETYKGYDIMAMNMILTMGDKQSNITWHFARKDGKLYSPVDDNLCSIEDVKDFIDEMETYNYEA